MYTRAEVHEKVFGHVLLCDIDEDLSSVVALRKNDKWFYLSVDTEDIENDHVLGQYERRASACRRQQIAYMKLCNDEEAGGKGTTRDERPDTDSGYSSEEPAANDEDAEAIFREWLQEPLQEIFERHAPSYQHSTSQSLHDWYETSILCFSLTASPTSTQLEAVPRKDIDSHAYLHSTIIPNMQVPKYISSRKDIPWYSPSQITVLSASHDIHMPLHPNIVRVHIGDKDDEYKDCFLKLCAEFQEPAVKREIRLLADLKKKEIYNEGVHAPTLEGIVTLPSNPNSRTHMLGFLLALIPQPSRPLTKLMTSEISESKRKAWAKGVKQQINLLHQHGFLWGDAKADNFLVDRDDKLWIIDFGGSYTVGWLDQKRYETKKGEREVAELISKGVKDPDHCQEIEHLVGETDESAPSQSEEARKAKAEETTAPRGEKRKHTTSIDKKYATESDDDLGPNAKRRR